MADSTRRWGSVGVRIAAAAWAVASIWTSSAADLRGAQTPPPQDPKQVFEIVYNGWKWWHSYCFRCHGMNAVGPTPLGPSLIEAKARVTPLQFVAKVKTGSPHPTVPGWNTLLDHQITEIYAYVEARTDKVLPPGRPDEVGPNGGHWVPPPGWSARK
jgi:mono/diheme cytochrome c family protein